MLVFLMLFKITLISLPKKRKICYTYKEGSDNMKLETVTLLKQIIKENLIEVEKQIKLCDRQLEDMKLLEGSITKMEKDLFGILELPEAELDRILALSFQHQASDVTQQLNYIRSLYRRLGSGKATSFNLEMYKPELKKIALALKAKVKDSEKKKQLIVKNQESYKETEKQFRSSLEHLEKNKKGMFPNSYLFIDYIDNTPKSFQEKYQICFDLLSFNNKETTHKRALLLDRYAEKKQNELKKLVSQTIKEKLSVLNTQKKAYETLVQDSKFSVTCASKTQKKSFDFICDFSADELKQLIYTANEFSNEDIALNEVLVIQYLIEGMRKGLEIKLTEEQIALVNQIYHIVTELRLKIKEKQKEMETDLRSLGKEISNLQEFEKQITEKLSLSDNEILNKIEKFFQENKTSYEYRYQFLKDIFEQKEF